MKVLSNFEYFPVADPKYANKTGNGVCELREHILINPTFSLTYHEAMLL